MTVTRVGHSPVVTRQVRHQTGKSVHRSGSQSEVHGQAQAWLYGVGDRYTYTIAQGEIESHGLSLKGAPEPMGRGVGGGLMAGHIRHTQSPDTLFLQPWPVSQPATTIDAHRSHAI